MSEARSGIPVDDVLENVRRLVGEEAGRGNENRAARPGYPSFYFAREPERALPDAAESDIDSDAAASDSEYGTPDASGAGWADSDVPEAEVVETSDAPGVGWADSGAAGESPGTRDAPGGGWPGSGVAETGSVGAETSAGARENESPGPAATSETGCAPNGGAESPDEPRLVLTDEMRVRGFAAGEGSRGSTGTAGAESPSGVETLRDLVSEMVREELSGGVGERAVRQLVRREIHRILANRDSE